MFLATRGESKSVSRLFSKMFLLTMIPSRFSEEAQSNKKVAEESRLRAKYKLNLWNFKG